MDVPDPNLKDSRFFIANLHNFKLSNKLQIYIEIKQLRHTFITSEDNQQCDEETTRKTKAMAFSREAEEQSPLRCVGPAPSAELTRLV